MKLFAVKSSPQACRRGFSLVELLFASGIGIVLGGAVVILLFQAAKEQRKGLVNASLEEQAYILQANISTCLRAASCNQGFTPDYSSVLTNSSGNALGYKKIFIFNPTNGAYLTGCVQYNSTSGQVLYTPNILAPGTQFLWMTNSATTRLTKLCFSTSLNPDGSLSSSLVNVLFQMDDNGYSQQNPTNNPASIYRSFAIQMRND